MTRTGERTTARWAVIPALALALATASAGAVSGQDGSEAGTAPDMPGSLVGEDLEAVELAPGVYQVLRDGVRDLTRPLEIVIFDPNLSPGDVHRLNAVATHGLAANANGVWLGGPDGVFRLGHDDLVWETGPNPDATGAGLIVTPADRLYRGGDGGAGEILAKDEWKPVVPTLGGFEADGSAGRFTQDGSLWVRGTNAKQGDQRRAAFARRDADGWTLIGSPPRLPGRAPDKRPASVDHWGVSDSGVLYVSRARRQVQRYADGRWETLAPPGGRIAGLHVGPDGAVWVERESADGRTYAGSSEFARLDEDGWTGYELGPPRYLSPSPAAVGADGALWLAPGGDLMSSGGCAGIIRVGTGRLDRFLLDHCIYDVAPGPSGELWLEAGTWDGSWYAPASVGPVGVYVITPAAWT
ncbi:MAG: hypothetical protein AB1Z67_03235 [Candidatus Limnocylindrales bacterium]